MMLVALTLRQHPCLTVSIYVDVCWSALQVGQLLPYRPANDTWNTTASDVLAPNQCVAGQLGGAAQFTGCDVRSE